MQFQNGQFLKKNVKPPPIKLSQILPIATLAIDAQGDLHVYPINMYRVSQSAPGGHRPEANCQSSAVKVLSPRPGRRTFRTEPEVTAPPWALARATSSWPRWMPPAQPTMATTSASAAAAGASLGHTHLFVFFFFLLDNDNTARTKTCDYTRLRYRTMRHAPCASAVGPRRVEVVIA